MVIALIPQHARRIKPPRTLAVPFELGRPLGVPNDADFQLHVLRAALNLLTRDSPEPVFEFYESDVASVDANGEHWSCPVTFAPKAEDDTSWASLVSREINLLRPWYENGLRERGRTTVGLSGLEIEDLPAFLARFVESPENSEHAEDQETLDGMILSDALKYAAEDLKAFYNESATAQPGNVTARDIEHWYWNETSAGQMVREISVRCRQHPDQRVQIVAGYTLVPVSQRSRESAG